jgi:hypothetical protein
MNKENTCYLKSNLDGNLFRLIQAAHLSIYKMKNFTG